MDKTAKTIETYNLHVSSYENKFMDFASYAKRIKIFCDSLEPGASILDVGCGPGNVEKLLVESGKEFEILGIDLRRLVLVRMIVYSLIIIRKNLYREYYARMV